MVYIYVLDVCCSRLLGDDTHRARDLFELIKYQSDGRQGWDGRGGGGRAIRSRRTIAMGEVGPYIFFAKKSQFICYIVDTTNVTVHNESTKVYGLQLICFLSASVVL